MRFQKNNHGIEAYRKSKAEAFRLEGADNVKEVMKTDSKNILYGWV
jgi:hypothetical protein